MGRKSPFAAPSIEAAYADYCALVVPLHKGQAERAGKTYRKPTKAAWIKKNQRRYDEFQQAMTETPLVQEPLLTDADLNGDAPTPATGTDLTTFVQTLTAAGVQGQALIQAITAFQANNGTTPTVAPTFRTRHTKDEQNKDAARNGLLWALNDEGLLAEALEASPGDYITQEAGLAIMTRTFGPLAARA